MGTRLPAGERDAAATERLGAGLLRHPADRARNAESVREVSARTASFPGASHASHDDTCIKLFGSVKRCLGVGHGIAPIRVRARRASIAETSIKSARPI